MIDQTNHEYHDSYECGPGEHCVGELRYELLTDALGQPLPDSSKVEFVLWWGDKEYPLSIQGGGVTEMNATIDLGFIEGSEFICTGAYDCPAPLHVHGCFSGYKLELAKPGPDPNGIEGITDQETNDFINNIKEQ